MKKILNISFSKTGGAGVIARSLTEAQRALGHDSEFINVSDAGVFSSPLSNFRVINQAIIDRVLVQKNQSSSLFSLFRNDRKVTDLLDTDQYVINLHWTPGIINLEDIKTLNSQKRKYFWTLHDMWPLTGGCHYAFECKKFESNCTSCPQAKKILHNLIVKQKQTKKNLFYNENLIAITPSHWLAELTKKSKNFQSENVHVIHNGIDIAKFQPKEIKSDRDNLVIGLSASDLSDQRKGIQKAIEWIKTWSSRGKNTQRVKVILQGKNFSSINGAGLELIHSKLSYEKIQEFYNSLDIFVSLSVAENFPTTVIEAQACGIPTIVNDQGGAKEIVEDGQSGFVINSSDQFNVALDHLLNKSVRNEFSIRARDRAENCFDKLIMAKKYIELYATYS